MVPKKTKINVQRKKLDALGAAKEGDKYKNHSMKQKQESKNEAEVHLEVDHPHIARLEAAPKRSLLDGILLGIAMCSCKSLATYLTFL